MRVEANAPLGARNTLRVAATARYLVRVGGTAAVAPELEKLLAEPRFRGLPRLVLGGGSNVLFASDFPGVVIMPQAAGIEIQETAESVIVSAAAGHDWHRLVEFTVARGWGGLENLSLIPGAVGAAPIQNIGAYGAQLSDVFVDLEAVPLDGDEPRTMDAAACAFGYRDSVFKQALRDTMLITRVRLRLHRRPRLNLEYTGVREELAGMAVTEPTVADVSRAIVRLRRRKLPDPELLPERRLLLQEPGARSGPIRSGTGALSAHCRGDGAGRPQGAGGAVDRGVRSARPPLRARRRGRTPRPGAGQPRRRHRRRTARRRRRGRGGSDGALRRPPGAGSTGGRRR